MATAGRSAAARQPTQRTRLASAMSSAWRVSPWAVLALAVCVLLAQINSSAISAAVGLPAGAPALGQPATLADTLAGLDELGIPVPAPEVRTTCLGGVPSSNLIVAENSCPGTDAWRVDHPIGPADAIEGFTDAASVNVGQEIHLYVSTTASTYSFQVYRLGWYQGHGARLVYRSPTLAGIQQPDPIIDPITGMVSCTDWIDPVTLAVPLSWVSGVYIVKLLSSAGYMRYTLFVVRDDASRAPVLVQLGVMTYEAYNSWGGRGLYAYNSQDEDPSPKVSFDRPYAAYDGLGLLPQFEFPLIQWLERNGYDASYIADVDLALSHQPLTRHRLIVVAGHDEYWTTTMRQRITAARDAGVSLAFFGANDMFWHARLESSPLGPGRVVVCYRSAALDPLARITPAQTTVEWREAPISQPENSLLGAMFAGIPRAPAPLVLAAGAKPFLAGTGLAVGSALPGLVFGEIDTYFRNSGTPAGVDILAASPVSCGGDWCSRNDTAVSTATLYTARSGARVFDAGTFYWARGLDAECMLPASAPCGSADAGLQRLTSNLLAYLLRA